MQRISRLTLALVALVGAVAGYALSAGPLGTVPPIGWGWITFVLVAVVDVALAMRIRAAISDGGIGQDRSQMHPVTVARSVALGQASAVLGALAGGAGAGLSGYCLVMRHTLVAAATELPFALAVTVSGVALTAAGLFLEASCSVPPGDEDPGVSAQPA